VGRDRRRHAGVIGLPGLRAVRLARGWSQQQLAEASGVNRTTISNLEVGVQDAYGQTRGRIAAVLGVSMAQLLLGDDYPAGATAAPQTEPPPPRKRRRASPTDVT
jgi:transcriptional regulator with XRE-family HTH domain